MEEKGCLLLKGIHTS